MHLRVTVSETQVGDATDTSILHKVMNQKSHFPLSSPHLLTLPTCSQMPPPPPRARARHPCVPMPLPHTSVMLLLDALCVRRLLSAALATLALALLLHATALHVVVALRLVVLLVHVLLVMVLLRLLALVHDRGDHVILCRARKMRFKV